MPPTPGHGTKLSDTGEREAAGADEKLAHFFRCWDRPGGPGYEMRAKVDEIQSGFVDMTATIRTWGRAIAGAVTLLTLAVAFLGYLATRDQTKASRIVPQAHAETTKGTP